MSALTVTAKGQITLKRDLLEHLRAAPGQQLEVSKLANGVVALHVKSQQGLEVFAGCLPQPQQALSLEEMDALIAQSWAQR